MIILVGPLVTAPFAMGKTKGHRTSKMGWPVDRSTKKLISPSSYKLNTQFGFNVVSGSSVNSGFQLGRLVYSRFPIYVGPELSFMLFSPGSILNVLVGGWVENHLFSNHRKTIDFGIYGGLGFSNQRPSLKTTNPILSLDISYSQQIDDFSALRGQIRPSFINGKVLCSVNMNAQFQFH
ncbi:MAG: hypothetical protein EXR74_00750 [Bdellovibrionales bacterium]|nr:hypothetical protein [Bdellovibrionales bacterium]